MGRAVVIPPEEEELRKEKFKLNQFNLLASDKIALNRTLPDVRAEGYVVESIKMGPIHEAVLVNVDLVNVCTPVKENLCPDKLLY